MRPSPSARGDDREPIATPPVQDPSREEALSRGARFWDAGGRAFSGVYWGCAFVFVAALWRVHTLPFVDYPQHLALAASLRRMAHAGAPERLLFDTNLASYNSLFHVLVAALNFVLPIDDAGKVVVGGYFLLMAGAALALLRATGRPRARAFLLFTVLAGFSLAWGFVNFGLGLAIELFALARLLDGLTTRPLRWKWDVKTALIALLGAYAHLMAAALVFALALTVIVAAVQSERDPFALRIGRAVRRGVPFLPAIAYCLAITVRQSAASYRSFEYASAEGNDVFALIKVRSFADYAAGLRADGRDAKLVSAALFLLFISAVLRDPEDKRPSFLRWMWIASAALYVVVPHVCWATNFVFQRISFMVALTAILWAPRALPRFEWPLRVMFVTLGVSAAGNFFVAMNNVRPELADLDDILSVAPPGRRILGLVWAPTTQVMAQPVLLHAAAYYVARSGGESAFSFSRFMSLPVHYRAETLPPVPPKDFEWQPDSYDPNAAYAHYFDLVLVKTATAGEDTPRAKIWGLHAGYVEELAHRGQWWLFEAKGLLPR